MNGSEQTSANAPDHRHEQPERRGDEWHGLVSDDDLAIYSESGFGRSSGLGRRPALVVIDVQYRTVGHARVDTLTAIRTQYATACGNPGWDAIDQLTPVLAAARASDVPVFFPYVAPKSRATAGRVADKNIHIADIESKGYEFIDEVRPAERDLLIPKNHPSAFFGTSMLSLLIERGVDTLLVAGATTSGCVRATVVDAFSLNFRVGVVRDAVFDRASLSHRASLFDIANKYADLLFADEAAAYLSRVATEGRS